MRCVLFMVRHEAAIIEPQNNKLTTFNHFCLEDVTALVYQTDVWGWEYQIYSTVHKYDLIRSKYFISPRVMHNRPRRQLLI
jgi:hypothetical protein